MSVKSANNYLQLELHVPDFVPVKSYYSKLGFRELKPAVADPEYLVMQMDSNVIRFWSGNQNVYNQTYFKKFPNNTPRGYGVEVVVMVDGVEAYYQKVKDFANVVEPLKTQPWGSKDFRTADPFGYYLRFSESHNILDNANAVN